jgi:hypothetical protein
MSKRKHSYGFGDFDPAPPGTNDELYSSKFQQDMAEFVAEAKSIRDVVKPTKVLDVELEFGPKPKKVLGAESEFGRKPKKAQDRQFEFVAKAKARKRRKSAAERPGVAAG